MGSCARAGARNGDTLGGAAVAMGPDGNTIEGGAGAAGMDGITVGCVAGMEIGGSSMCCLKISASWMS
jgi:hypothetical protein